ncbi:MAG: extracellular solute-binding protein, partial [Planctomycetota bacterium]
MRWVILGLVAVWTVLTAFGYLVVIPEQAQDRGLIEAYFRVGTESESAEVRELMTSFAASRGMRPEELGDIPRLPEDERIAHEEAFRTFLAERGLPPLSDAPVLIWSTDDNPARKTQCQLFRDWHLMTYGEPVDIQTDPSNRDITKAIVQCVAGRGPDLIESYGPEQLRQFVQSGVALDVTERANEEGFGLSSIFEAARPSSGVVGPDGTWAQFAFPCNVGYTVLFFHRDLFEDAGVAFPRGPWSIEEASERARALIDHAEANGTRRFGIMNLGAWDMGVHAGGRFFDASGVVSYYNAPETVDGLTTFHRMIYVDDVAPTPAEAASVAASGGASMQSSAEAASASSLFAAK